MLKCAIKTGVLCLLAAVMSATTLADATETSSPQVLRMTHSVDYAPLFYVDDAGNSAGILVDYWRLWSERTGVKIEFQPMPWYECLAAVRDGRADVVPGVAHEINTPVGAINSMQDTEMRTVKKVRLEIESELEADHPARPGLLKYLETIEEAGRVIVSGTERVSNIVRRLRSFARLDESELKTVDIHEGLEDTLALIHNELKHTVTVHRDFGKLPRIACYPGQLNQVFLNLLINAKQAIESIGEIRITTSQKDDHVLLVFEDNGGGIPADKLRHVFDPGFTTKGVGLGLAICYQIIRQHQGDIRAESEMGKGTKFTITRPTNLAARDSMARSDNPSELG